MAISSTELAVEGGGHRLTGWDGMWVSESGRGWSIGPRSWRMVGLSSGIVHDSVGTECYCSLRTRRLGWR